MYALNLSEDNRILSAWTVLSIGNYDDMPIVDKLPEGDVYDYLYIDDEFIHNPLPPEPEPEPEPEYVTYDELAAAIREGVNSYGQ